MLFSAAVFFLPRLAAQETRAAQFKVKSGLVLVDLLATDGEGKNIEDLKAGEVRIFEDNKEKTISFFEKKQPSPGTKADQTLISAPSHVIQAQSDAGTPSNRGGVMLAFMIDLQSIEASQLPQIKDAIAAFAKSGMGAENRMMLVAAGNGTQVYQAPTRDMDQFLGSLGKIHVIGDVSSRLLRFGDDVENFLLMVKGGSMNPGTMTRRAITMGREYMSQEEACLRATRDNALALVREIGALPGRKNVLFFSSGYRSRIGIAIQDVLLQAVGDYSLPGGDTTGMQIKTMLGAMTSMEKLESYMRAIIEEANRWQVSFYTIDARSLATREDIRVRRASRYSDQLVREEFSQPQDFLRAVSSGTGGRWFLNRNDLDAGIERAYVDASTYYQLGYVPEGGAKPGTLHRITVKVNRPHAQVSHRQSFVEPEEIDPEHRAIENAFRFPELFQDFSFEADAAFRNQKLKIDVFVPTKALSFVPAGERRRCELAVHMALFEGDGKLYQGKTLCSKTYKLDLSDAEYANLGKIANVTSSFQGEVLQGNYRLRIVVRQILASKTATLERHIVVP